MKGTVDHLNLKEVAKEIERVEALMAMHEDNHYRYVREEHDAQARKESYERLKEIMLPLGNYHEKLRLRANELAPPQRKEH